MTDFFQEAPVLTNTFTSNRWLRSYLRYKLPRDMWSPIETDLTEFGESCAGTYRNLARQAESERPALVPYDAWGVRTDEIKTSAAWNKLKDISAREGLIAIGYERQFSEFSRLYQFSKLFLFHPSSAFFTCPLAMADGAAQVLERYGTEPVHKTAFLHLTSSDPKKFWTSGQWMTEKTGGSDVSGTSTRVEFENDLARLYGTKWFSSATTSEVALALARLPGSPSGSRGLTLFQIPMYLERGKLNHIQVLRLKDKLGTWALPTAELKLEGSYAFQVGRKDEGVKTVASMLNITRLYNSVCAIGQTTRALELMKSYSLKRQVFNQTLDDQVLHFLNFAQEEVKNFAGFLLTMELSHILGKQECHKLQNGEEDLLRLMIPVCKMFTARNAVQTASETVEGFGGAGYIENTGIPEHLRNAQVFPIWEGATNVLSLDVLKVLQKTGAGASFPQYLKGVLSQIKTESLQTSVAPLLNSISNLENQMTLLSSLDSLIQMANARRLGFHLAWLYATVLAVKWADQETEVNRRSLMLWIGQMTQMTTPWNPLSVEDISRAHGIWNTHLKVD